MNCKERWLLIIKPRGWCAFYSSSVSLKLMLEKLSTEEHSEIFRKSDLRDHQKAKTLLISELLKGRKAHEATVGLKAPFCLGTDPNTLQAHLVHGWDISQIVHQRTFAPSQTLQNSNPHWAVLFQLLFISDSRKKMITTKTQSTNSSWETKVSVKLGRVSHVPGMGTYQRIWFNFLF